MSRDAARRVRAGLTQDAPLTDASTAYNPSYLARAAPVDVDSVQHHGLRYDGDDEVLAVAVPFITAGRRG